MEFSIKNGNAEKQRTACVVVGVFERRKLSEAAEAIDKASNGYLSSLMRRGDMDGKLGTTLMAHSVPGTLTDRVLLVGCGKEREFREREYRRVVGASVKALESTGASDVATFLAELPVKRRDLDWRVEQLVTVASSESYRFSHPNCKKAEETRALEKMIVNVPQRPDLARGEAALQRALAIAAGVEMAKTLGNLPGNICTPTYLAEQAREMAITHGLQIEVLERADMETLGMGSLLSVARGSRQPPKFDALANRHKSRWC